MASTSSRLESSPSPRALLWPIALAAVIVLGSSRTMPEVPGTFPGFDKLAHFGAYGLLGTLLLRSPIIWRRRLRFLLTVGLVSLFGATDELHQYFTPGRSCELADWISDTLGPALAAACYLGWPRYRRLLEMPVRLRRRPAPQPAPAPLGPAIAGAAGSGGAPDSPAHPG